MWPPPIGMTRHLAFHHESIGKQFFPHNTDGYVSNPHLSNFDKFSCLRTKRVFISYRVIISCLYSTCIMNNNYYIIENYL